MSSIQPAGAMVLGPDDGKRVILAPGNEVLFKAWGRRRAGDWELAEFKLSVGAGPLPHRHRANEHLFYVLRGEVEFLIGDRSAVLGAGSVAYVPPDTVHAFRNAGAEEACFLLVDSPSGHHRYFDEVQALAKAGALTATSMTELRRKYDTEEVDLPWEKGQHVI